MPVGGLSSLKVANNSFHHKEYMNHGESISASNQATETRNQNQAIQVEAKEIYLCMNEDSKNLSKIINQNHPNETMTSAKMNMNDKSKTPNLPLPCYSDLLPPEIGSRVVVRCDRVDDNGVWGTLPDWNGAPFSTKVYLPLGYIAQARGRGERRAQADFMTRAKRLVSKGKPFQFVGEVDDVEEASCNAVDSITNDGRQITQTFLLTVYRRGLSKQDEKDVMEASKLTQHCATHIVDKAAKLSSFSREQARRWCLYGPYHQFQMMKSTTEGSKQVGHNAESTAVVDPTLAAHRLLIEQFGKLSEGREGEVLGMLHIPEGERCSQVDSFVKALVALCRKEHARTSKPIPFSLTGRLSDCSVFRSVSVARSVFADVLKETQLPTGFTNLKITAEGGGTYKFSTTGPKDESENAAKVLELALSKARDLYTSTSSEDIHGMKKEEEVANKDDHEVQQCTQPTLNIGLIGDVANGKSTLVRAVTGKRTQSHSTEQQKHGMTIRLGFANASVLRCEGISCGMYSFRQDEIPEELEKQPTCACCGGSAEVVTRVSFIDCPGHSELMATMLSGASAFDVVIVAAAANIPCPSPQARQHLDALKVSRRDYKGRIAVAQTKAELLAQVAGSGTGEVFASGKLAAHASSARENLRKTVASDAPFFPTCAPLGAGLEPLAAWLANLASKGAREQGDEGHRIFQTLRSFDINYAGTDACKLAGGVLGGSISGSGSIARGETLEIRPGLVATEPGENSSKFKARPVMFQVEEIMTGKDSLDQASAGGLVALRTTLDPAFCTDDRLIGSVVGSPGVLPPVWGPTICLDKLRSLDSSSSKKKEKILKKASKVKVHAGSATVTGRVVRVSHSKQKIELLLDAPICASRFSNVAIEAKSSEGNFAGYTLAACGSITDGTVCCDGVDEEPNPAPPEDTVAPIVGPDSEQKWSDEKWVRDRFLEELADKQMGNGEGPGVVSVPSPMIEQDGGAHVVVENFSQIALALNRDPAHLQSYLQKEAGLSCTRAGENGAALRVRVRIRGFHDLMGRILCRYVSRYVACRQCKSAKTEFLKNGAVKDQIELLCRQCNARRFVPKIA